MTLFFNAETISYLGYTTLFLFIALGFLFLKLVDKAEEGPGIWAFSFLSNALGFLFWSLVLPVPTLVNYGLGELLHICGFFLLIIGAYRFMHLPYRWWNLALALGIFGLWIVGLWLVKHNAFAASIVLKGVRLLMFTLGGLLLLYRKKGSNLAGKGRLLAGSCMLAWAAWLFLSAFVKLEAFKELYFGILVGMQVLAAFGMIVMLVENKQSSLEHSESKLK
ncbi:MAG TPA: hypothetical protein PLC54_03250 [Spirochaetales bacterium]|nr:hypothetical protein [Spirochaetales bacterium]